MKKGFTLIELLGVITLLGLIALIAVPAVSKSIKNKKEELYEDQIEFIISSAKLWATDNKLELSELLDRETKTITLKDLISNGYIDDEIKNPLTDEVFPTCVEIKIKRVSNNYEYTVTNLDCKVEVTTTTTTTQTTTKYTVYKNGESVYYNPTAGSNCTAGENGCMKFYAFNDVETSSTVNLILDHNTTPLVAWNSTGSNAEMKEVKEKLEADTTGWIVAETYDGLNARLITADEVAEITRAKKTLNWDSKISTSAWFYLDGAKGPDSTWQTQIAMTTGASEYAWLFDNTYGCTGYGCDVEDNNKYAYNSSGSTSYIYGYWTSIHQAGSASYAWHVFRNGSLSNSNVNSVNAFGVRPVITVSKSVIK